MAGSLHVLAPLLLPTWALVLPSGRPPVAAPRAAPTMAESRPADDALLRWVEDEGGSTRSVLVEKSPFGWGLVAAQALGGGDVAVSVPAPCVLSAASLGAPSAPLEALRDAVPPEFWSARLALLLLAERAKGAESRLASFMATLPSSYPVPLFWSREAVGALKGYPTAQQRLLKQAKFVAQFGADVLPGSEAFSGVEVGTDAFGWAVAACSSRAFLVGDERSLVPVIDLGNHAPRGEASCEVRRASGGAVELVALRPLRAGEAVTYCYGERSSDDFLIDYGFVPQANAHDDVKLAWAGGGMLSAACAAAGVDEPLADWQRAALRTSLPASYDLAAVTPTGVDEHAMAACRIAAAADGASLRKADGGRRALAQPSAEVRALKVAAAMGALALGSLPEAEPAAAEPAGAAADVALAHRYLDSKRAVCSSSMRRLAERIKAVQSGEGRKELRGGTRKKAAAGVRKRSARKGAARQAPSGFG